MNNEKKVSIKNKVKMVVGGVVVFVAGYKLATKITMLKFDVGLLKLMTENPDLKTSLENAIEKTK